MRYAYRYTYAGPVIRPASACGALGSGVARLRPTASRILLTRRAVWQRVAYSSNPSFAARTPASVREPAPIFRRIPPMCLWTVYGLMAS